MAASSSRPMVNTAGSAGAESISVPWPLFTAHLEREKKGGVLSSLSRNGFKPWLCVSGHGDSSAVPAEW